MPRKVAGDIRVVVDEAFCQALVSGDDLNGTVTLLPKVKLGSVSSKTLTRLMKNDTFDFLPLGKDMCTGWKTQRVVKHFQSLAFPVQTTLLIAHGVYLADVTDGSAPGPIEQPHVASGDLGGEATEEDGSPEEDEVKKKFDEDSWVESSDDSAAEYYLSETDAEEDPLDSVPVWKKPRRVREKKGPEAGHGFHMDPKTEMIAVIPSPVKSSRITRDLRTTVFGVDWGSRTHKPLVLRIFGHEHRPGLSTTLHLISGREDGQCYYASNKLVRSASAMWVTQHCSTLEWAYSRMMLLFSPSAIEVLFDPAGDSGASQPEIVYVPIHKNKFIADPRDGQAEVSLSLAVDWGLVQELDAPKRGGVRVVASWQFRGMIYVPGLSQLCLCKGMLVLNPAFTGKRLELPHSTIKVQGEYSDRVRHGVEIVKSTSRRISPPQLTTSLLSILHMRNELFPTALERAALRKKLAEWVGRLNQARRKNLAHELWELSKSSDSVLPKGYKLIKLGCDSPQKDKISTTPASSIDVHVSNDLACTTSLESLLVTHPEAQATSLLTGRKEALTAGNNRLLSLARRQKTRPTLKFGAFSTTLVARSDDTYTLEPRTCYAIVGGRSLVGKVAVWRCPLQLPWDIEIWEALPWPDGITTVSDNTLYVSRKGFALTRMAGGDFDGDLCMLSTDPDLLHFLSITASAVESVDIESYTKRIDDLLEKQQGRVWRSASCGLDRADQMVAYIAKLPTPQLRGLVCSWAERAALHAMVCDDDDSRSGKLAGALHLGILSHRAMDVPKHFTVDQIKEVLRLLVNVELQLKSRVHKRSTQELRTVLQLELPEMNYKHPWMPFGKNLKKATAGVDLGQLWIPAGEVSLSSEAGSAVRSLLLERVLRTRPDSSEVTPLRELAALLADRLRQAGPLRALLNNGDPAKMRQVLERSRKGKVLTLASLQARRH